MTAAAQKPTIYQLDIDNEHARSLLRKLNQMREDQTECDLVIKVDGRELHVHRNIMRAGSDYFDAMFSHDTKEKKSGIVEMKGIGFCVAKKCVTFLYTGKISITEEECEPLLYAAGMMQLAPVCENIASFLESHLNASSFFNIKRIANKYDLEALCKVCDEFALKNFDSLVKEEGFGNLKQEYFSFLITSEKLSSSITEESKLVSILQWVKGDIENRRKNLVDWMNLLDLKKVSIEYGRFLAENETLCSESAECMKLLLLGVTEGASKGASKQNAHTSDCNALVVFNTESKYLEAYQPAKNSWSRIQRLHNQMCGRKGFYTAVVCNNILYVLMETMEVYMTNYMKLDPKWVQKRSMTMNHGIFMRAAVHGQFIYVIGESMERYCTVKNKWEIIQAKGIPCHECAVAEYMGYIYNLGGYRGKCLADVNRLSPSLLTWSPVKPMLERRGTPAVAVYNEKMFVVGGDTKSNQEAEFYDINLDSWTRISPMNIEYNSFGLCVADNRLFSVGRDGNSDSLVVEVYDIESKKWELVLNIHGKRIMSPATVALCLPK